MLFLKLARECSIRELHSLMKKISMFCFDYNLKKKKTVFWIL